MVVSKPRLIHQNRFLDFGFGFYTTNNRVQAVAFAKKVYRRRRGGGENGQDYDLIYGPGANEDVYTTFTLYSAGALTKEQILEAFKIKKRRNLKPCSSSLSRW